MRSPLPFAAVVILVAGSSACGSVSMTLTGAAQPPRNQNCEFSMLTAGPPSGFSEIGVVDVTPGYATSGYQSLSDFKRQVRPLVCKAGGDAAIAQANGYGMYLKATILKATPSAATSTDGAAHPASPGCQYDTQCKGDRICVSGQCKSPEKNQ